ncbi:MAG: Error-prone DNA polymerase [Phycisphaerales bacterium]|nr:Error-prone DNA polymerase [Phycisphaerales bacterium]
MPAEELPKARPHPFRQAQRRAHALTCGSCGSGFEADARQVERARDAVRASTTTGIGYAELSVTSNYTFLTGASHPEEFVYRAAELGHRAVAVTDTNTVAGIVRAHVAAKEVGIQLVIGSRLRFTDAPGWSVLVYPTDLASYGRLCRLLTIGKRRAEKGSCKLGLEDLAAHSTGLLGIAAAGSEVQEDFERTVQALRGVFGGDAFWIAVNREYAPWDEERLRRIEGVSLRTGVPLVATNDVHYHTADRRALQDVLTCIRHGCTVAEAGARLAANAERHLKSPDEMARLLGAIEGAVERSVEIADRARGFSLDQLRYQYPEEVVPKGKTAQEHLAELAWQGAERIYGSHVPAKVVKQLEHELKLIEELAYAPYFLTVHDLVRYARTGAEGICEGPKEGWEPILCQGRGAAANSAVCFCLGVTSVDPARIDVLFERFVSKERNEPPDIDIDFEHERREEVIQYLYRKYGRERAALTAEVITYRRRSAVRDVGKALGLSLDLVDRLAKDVEWFDDGVLNEQRLKEHGVNGRDATVVLLGRLVGQIVGFPRHLSQHVGGFVITRGPLCELVPVENAAMADRTVIEWDKDDIDAVGMLKVDVLGLGMLTVIGKCLELVNRRHRGTKAPRHKGELSNGNDTDIQGSARLAEGDEAREERLQNNGEDAGIRALRPHCSDEACGDLDSFEHRGGLRPSNDCGLPAISSYRTWIAGRADHAVRAGLRDGNDLARCRDRLDTDGNRPDASIADHEDRSKEKASIEAGLYTSCLCASVPLCLRTIPPEDPDVYEMICRADTVGVFQIESRAQMSMLPRLRPREFYDLVIEVAIVRPGPIQGGMVHPYLRRRAGEEPVPPAPHPAFEEVLGKTLGVPLFQEQCMALAVKAAGFTAGEADQLRRAMAAWKRKSGQIARFGMKLVEGMKRNGIPEEFARRCFEQIKGFSEYGFPESHAASFALLVYASAWLKKHYPAEFCCSLLNSQPMGFYAPAQLVRDAREHGVEVRGVDVNFSGWDCGMEEGVEVSRCQGVEGGNEEGMEAPGHGATRWAVRLGLRMVSGMSKADGERIAGTVAQDGAARSIVSLWRRSGVSASVMRRLAAADAFGSMGLSRQQALWQVRLLRDVEMPLFDGLEERTAGDGYDALPAVNGQRQVVIDYDTTGLSLRAHPVSFARDRLGRLGARPCSAMRDETRTRDGDVVTVAGLVLVRQRPGTANDVTFMTIEDETGIANLIVWKRVYQRYRRAACSTLVVATGRVQRQGEVVHVVVTRMRGFDEAVEGLSSGSRDFR